MTQSQTHQQYLARLRFYSLSSICTWAGKPQEFDSIGILDKEFPYIEKNGTYYYFGNYGESSVEYRLVCTSLNDLGAQKV